MAGCLALNIAFIPVNDAYGLRRLWQLTLYLVSKSCGQLTYSAVISTKQMREIVPRLFELIACIKKMIRAHKRVLQ